MGFFPQVDSVLSVWVFYFMVCRIYFSCVFEKPYCQGYDFVKIHLQDQITSGQPTVDWSFIGNNVSVGSFKAIEKLRISVGHDFGYESKFLVIEKQVTKESFPAYVREFQGFINCFLHTYSMYQF